MRTLTCSKLAVMWILFSNAQAFVQRVEIIVEIIVPLIQKQYRCYSKNSCAIHFHDDITTSPRWGASVFVNRSSIYRILLIEILKMLDIGKQSDKSVVRSSHRACSVKIGVLKNFANFTGKNLCWSLFLVVVGGKHMLRKYRGKFYIIHN